MLLQAVMLVTLAIQDSGHSDQVKALHDKNEEDGKDEGLFDLTYSDIFGSITYTQ